MRGKLVLFLLFRNTNVAAVKTLYIFISERSVALQFVLARQLYKYLYLMMHCCSVIFHPAYKQIVYFLFQDKNKWTVCSLWARQ